MFSRFGGAGGGASPPHESEPAAPARTAARRTAPRRFLTSTSARNRPHLVEHELHGLVDRHRRRVDEHRRLGLPQRGDRAALIPSITLLHVGERLVIGDVLPFANEL